MPDNKQRESIQKARADLTLEFEQAAAYLKSVSKGHPITVHPSIKQRVDSYIAKHTK